MESNLLCTLYGICIQSCTLSMDPLDCFMDLQWSTDHSLRTSDQREIAYNRMIIRISCDVEGNQLGVANKLVIFNSISQISINFFNFLLDSLLQRFETNVESLDALLSNYNLKLRECIHRNGPHSNCNHVRIAYPRHEALESKVQQYGKNKVRVETELQNSDDGYFITSIWHHSAATR